MVAIVEAGKVELEVQIRQLKNCISDLTDEQKKSESHAIDALKEKEKTIEALSLEIQEKTSMIGKADEVIDDIKRQSENLVAELQRKELEF